MLRRRHLYFLTRGNAEGTPYVDLQLRPNELQAIGRVTAQWAFLEFIILRETRNLAHHLRIPLSDDAKKGTFRRRREVWEELSLKALDAPTFVENKRRALDCIERAKNLANDRNRITHDIIEYDAIDENRLKAFSPITLDRFGWPLNATSIEKIAHNIARLTHDVLSIHNDPETVPGAPRRTQDKPDRPDSSPAAGTPGRRPASSRLRKPRR